MGLLNKIKRPSDLAVSIDSTEETTAPTLWELEAVVDAGLNSIAQVGLALDTIQTRKLYEPAYQDWPTYLDTRWKLTTDYANRLIQAAAIVAKITAAGLPELVTTSADDYEQLALRLYRDRSMLAALRVRLAANRLTCALFDTERYTRDLEALYIKMIDRHEKGLPPDHLFV